MFGKAIIYVFVLMIIITALMYTNTISAQIVKDGLICYWTFNRADIVDKTIKDLAGKNDATIAGDPKIVKGKFGDALEFDGVDDYVNLDQKGGTINDAINGLSAVTVGVWVNPATISATEYFNNVITIWINQSFWGFSINIEGADGNKARVGGRSQETDTWQDAKGTSEIPKGEWSYIVGILDFSSSKIYVYVNNELENVKKVNFGSKIYTKGANPRAEVIGWYGSGNEPGRFFHGIIDEVTIYNRILSDNEIKNNLLGAVKPARKMVTFWGEIKQILVR